MKYYAVIDTNVIIAALLTKNSDAATLKVLRAVLDGSITPLYHEDILSEYDEVLHRRKFHLQEGTIQLVLTAIKQYGLEVQPQPTGEILLDMDDLIFYEVQHDDLFRDTVGRKYRFRKYSFYAYESCIQ